jgi:metal-sulfur cluster biosynthetic enzyme
MTGAPDMPVGVLEEALHAALSNVLDPELDEPILDLGFVRALHLRDGVASVSLRLPTSWCAVNFAFIMAQDVRAALLAVPGVRGVTVNLGDHCAALEIAAAVNAGTPFSAAFAGNTGEGLGGLRSRFMRKGFLMRQEKLLRALREAGFSSPTIAAMRVGDATTLNSISADLLGRYLRRRGELGLERSRDDILIVDDVGIPVPAAELDAHYERIRTVRVAMEANGSLCRAALAGRSVTTTTNRKETSHVPA